MKISKKGAPKNRNNWRGITPLSVLSKILATLIRRISEAVGQQLRQEKAGLRKGRGCTDQIFTLRNIIQQCTEWQRQLYINYFNFEKAFDSIQRSTIYNNFKCRHYRLEIVGVSQARRNQFGETELATRELFIYSGKGNKDDFHERGIGITLSGHAKKCWMEWEPIDDRIVTARINAKIHKITIIQCYAPTNNAKPDEKEECYSKLQAVFDKAPNRDILIVMGDLNVKVGRNNASIERIMGKKGL